MTELLEARNDANAAHAFIENRMEDLRQRLLAIERRLSQLEGDYFVQIDTKPDTEPRPDMHDDDIDYGALRWRTQNEDGTWRDCID